jgi:hypothetical protein
MLHDQEENVPKQVVVLRKLLGPLEKFKVPIIPVALNTLICIGLAGVETPDQSDGLMKVLDAERGRARLSRCQRKIRVAFYVWRHEAHLPRRILSDTCKYYEIQTNTCKYDQIRYKLHVASEHRKGPRATLQVASEHRKAREQRYRLQASTEGPASNAIRCKLQASRKGPRATLQVASEHRKAREQRYKLQVASEHR